MERYNYRTEMYNDVRNAIETESQYEREEDESIEDYAERLYDLMWVDDSITGNASGSYWFNTWKAEEALCHNFDLLNEALTEFGCDASNMGKGAEYCDVTIRCYLLYSVISDVLDDMDCE